jgi:hypothetical protein
MLLHSCGLQNITGTLVVEAKRRGAAAPEFYPDTPEVTTDSMMIIAQGIGLGIIFDFYILRILRLRVSG